MRAYYSRHKHIRLFLLGTPEGWHVGLYDIQNRKWTDLDGAMPSTLKEVKDLQVQYFIWKLLKADGFTVLTGGNGAFALEASRNHPGPVDLLLTDMEMPRMGVLKLAETIAAERPGIKVLIMSGDLRDREGISVNGLPFLQKPVTPTALRESIETLLCPIPSSTGPYPSPLGNYSDGEIV